MVKHAIDASYFSASADPASGREIITLNFPEKQVLPLKKPKILVIPFDDWTQFSAGIAVAAVSRVLQAWSDNELDKEGHPAVVVQEGLASLSPAFVASLSEPEALILGLPPATPLILQITSRGGLQDLEFKLESSWIRPGGARSHVQKQGARLIADGKSFRLIEPLYSTSKQISLVNSAPPDHQRQEAMAALRLAMGNEAAAQIEADGYIDRLRLSYAAAFSLDLRISDQGFDFDPILFSRERTAASLDDAEMLDDVSDGLLPPEQQNAFASNFRKGTKARATYLLKDGGFLFIDPALKKALDVVCDKQKASEEERKSFVRNPRRVIREALGTIDDTADALFIETQQFSERVSGIDIWRKPVLPWIKPKPNSWLPETFGLRIGEGDDVRFVELKPEDASSALAAINDALTRGEPSVNISGVDVPATIQSQSALSAIVELAKAAETAQPNDPPPKDLHRYFLEVRDNLEETHYMPLSKRQKTDTQDKLVTIPAVVRSQAKPHQKVGFDWLVAHWQAGTPGALLADDMGLGKTFQALAFMTWLRTEAASDRPILIVAPTGLLAK